MESPFLDPEIVVELTGFRRKTKQAKQLVLMGIPYTLNANGIPKVLKEAIMLRSAAQMQQREGWRPKVAAGR